MPDAAAADVTCDAVLGGRLRLFQPARGHRAGHDAILLAAAVDARPGDHAVDLGAGVGTAGLALAQRVPGVQVTLVEKDSGLVALARRNIALNGIDGRAVALDVGAPGDDFIAADLPPQCAGWVLMNPPFHPAASVQPSPDASRSLAHVAPDDLLEGWMKAAARLLRPGGRVVAIYRADGLPKVLESLAGFGGVAVLPVYPRHGAAAIRVIVGGIKGSRAPLAMLPGLTLARPTGAPSPEAEAILRAAQPLPLWTAS